MSNNREDRVQFEIKRLTAEDGAVLERVADGVFDEPIDRLRVAACAEPIEPAL